MSKLKEYALYKGEEILCIGTVNEIAKKLNLHPKTVRFYSTGVHKRRVAKRKYSRNAKLLIRLEDDEVGEI